ncbi:DUF2479 domain-containing protein [Lactobacillus amylovorus]|uniref:DUF2479 domain-containing protein n=1 Tax=Lactobacillus amylovorus TaxID=1604 RepID=UPI002244468F|nr:DUF2479 domain-containing protein [Lactobacillus amylovorus]
MSLGQITLTTNKTVSNVGDYVRKIGQDERGQVLPVIVVDAIGTPYDLSDKKIVFSESKDSGKYVVDDGKDSRSGKFTLTDAKNGKFSYTLQEQVYPESGTAWFDIVSADGTVLDTTVSFRFVVIPAPTLHVNDDNYSSTLEALQAHYQGVIKNTETQTQNLINSLTDKINRAISNGQKDVANELSDARAKLQQITTDANNLKNSWNAEFETEKQNFTDLQNQWKAQTAKINQDANSQIQAINDNAAQQLKNNQSANDAAIKEVNGQRDAAINQANTNFQNELNKLQQDYNAWKAEKLADFTKSLQSLTDQINTDQADLTNFNKQLSDTKTELANMAKQLDSIDFARFVTGDQFKEAMSKKASGIKVRGLRGDYVMAVNANDSNIDATPSTQQAGLVDSGVLAAAVQALADAILDKNHYTKQEVDGIKQNILDTITNKTKDMATTQDVAANAQRITALENAGFAKIKLDGFSTADDAKKWSADNNGIAMFADEPETV